MAEIRLTLVLVVSGWSKPTSEGKTVRLWSGPPVGDGDPNPAAHVERVSGSWWPFSRWSWEAWSPFGDDAVAEGTSSSPEAAKMAADKALSSFVIAAERDMAGGVNGVAAQWASLARVAEDDEASSMPPAQPQ